MDGGRCSSSSSPCVVDTKKGGEHDVDNQRPYHDDHHGSTATMRESQTKLSSSRSRNKNDTKNMENNNVVRDSIIAGSSAGMASTAIMYPMDVIRTKIQTSGVLIPKTINRNLSDRKRITTSSFCGATGPASQLGPWQILRQTFRPGGGGISSLYTGLTLPLAAQGVYKATVFTINNMTERLILRHRGGGGLLCGDEGCLTLGDRFVCGFVAGTVNAALFVTPVEFVRNQLIAQQQQQQQLHESHYHHRSKRSSSRPTKPGSNNSNNMGSWDVIRLSVQRHGVGSLWRGIRWSVARDGLGCGCFFYTMSWAQTHLTTTTTSAWGQEDEGNSSSFAITVISGGLAGLAYWLAALPLDTVKTWVQSADAVTTTTRATTKSSSSPTTASAAATTTTMNVGGTIREIYNATGVVGVIQQLLRGWQAAYGRGIPSAAITVSVYSAVYQCLQND